MTVTHNSNEQIIGRDQINDIEAILSVRNTDPNAKSHSFQGAGETIFTWDYSLARPPLRKLYEKAKTGQWNGELDLPWETEVDIERTIAADQAAIGAGIDPAFYSGTPLAKWGDKEWLEFGIEGRRWMLSQFLHGEDCGDRSLVRRKVVRINSSNGRSSSRRSVREVLE